MIAKCEVKLIAINDEEVMERYGKNGWEKWLETSDWK